MLFIEFLSRNHCHFQHDADVYNEANSFRLGQITGEESDEGLLKRLDLDVRRNRR